MQTPIADFSITTERDISWAGQRTRLFGTLAGLRPKARKDLAKAVAKAAKAYLDRPLRGTAQFSLRQDDKMQFVEVLIRGDCSAGSLAAIDESTLRELVDELAIDDSQPGAIVIALRKQLTADLPTLGSDDIAEWGTVLATRTTESALVEAHRRLREVRSSSISVVDEADNSQIHELLALVASTTDNSVVVMDSAGQVEWVNDSFSRMTGYELNEVEGKFFPELMTGPQSDPAVEREIQSALKLGHGVSRDVLRYRKDGKTYWELLGLSPVFDEAGVATRWVSIGADISTRRAAEDALAQAKVNAEAASDAKSGFLANMSHEIRTPMNAVLGMTDLALATKLTPEQNEYLSIVKDSAQALMGLLNDILDLSKIEAGKLAVDAVPFDLSRLMESTLKPFAQQAEVKGIEFIRRIQPDTPSHVVGDAIRLRQILINLVSNAVKFTSLGRIAVNLEFQWESEEEVSLHLSVSDTGIGMSKETLQRIFDAFTQADSSITREYGGTGLGLSISARLVELMGGRIWVQSQEEKGSTFHVSLPFKKANDREIRSIPTHNGLVDSNQLDQPSCMLRVLVADDNEANRTLARRVLEKRGHQVTMVANGREALEEYGSNDFDLAILDVQMPELDGLSLTAIIRAKEMEGRPHLPLVALTAHARPEDRERCLQAGMDAYLSKPIDARELYTLVESLGMVREISIEHAAAPTELARHPFSTALARLEGDEELLGEQMQFFLDESPELMDQILAALDEEEQEQVRKAAHRLKGLAGAVDGGELCLIANRVEQSSASGSLDEVTEVIDELASALTRLTDQVSKYLEP